MKDSENYLAATRAKITAHGWTIQFVAASHDIPQSHYTVGIYPTADFEIITFGMIISDGAVVLDELAERVRRGTRFVNGQALTDVLAGGYAVTMLQVPDASAWLSIARVLYTPDGRRLPAWQMILPDAAHHLPWEQGYSGPHQPLLGPAPQ